MDYETFRASKKKPRGKTSSASPLGGAFPLDFDGADLALLDEFSSFEDLRSGIGIEESWSEDLPKIFPSLQPLASADMSALEEVDSYAEFLLLVDTASEGAPVYWFSAEWWDWDEWETNKNGFRELFSTFEEFYDSLIDHESPE